MAACPACQAECSARMSRCGSCGFDFGSSTQLGAVREEGETPDAIHPPGAVVGSYLLLEVLGEGGMGVVYLAEHTRLGRQVALKMLRSTYSENRQAVQRFFAEARAVNRISHENIVEITDFIESPGGDNYYIMELLNGTVLSRIIDQERVPAVPRSIGVMVQVTSALTAVHAAGIVHRDLKPDNIFLTERSGKKDFVKLLDFGVAKLALGQGQEKISLHNTAAGAILGTPEYMSPEQAAGKPVDHRTDIYAIGIILYELITGRVPFQAKSFGEMVVKHLTVDPTPIRKLKHLPHQIPSALEGLILHCLEKDPEDRPQNVAEVGQRLLAIADEHGWEVVTYSGRPGIAESTLTIRKRPRPSRSRWPLAAAALLVAAVGTFIALPGGDDGAAAPVDEVAAAPVKVAIEVRSEPPGAEVFRAGESESLGLTPVTLQLDRGTERELLELRKPGFRSVRRPVDLDRDARLEVTLAELPPAAAAAPTPAPVAVVTADPKALSRPAKRPRPKARPKPGKASEPTTAEPAKTAPPDRSGVMSPFE